MRALLLTVLCLCSCTDRLDRRPAAAALVAAPELPQTPPPEEHIAEGMGLVLKPQIKRNGQIDLHAANATRAPIRVQPRLTVERRVDGEWQIVEPLTFASLRQNCEQPPSECVTLVPGAELFPPTWQGRAGEAQCACSDCGAEIHGELRFVAMSCDMRTRYSGEPFAR